VERQRGAGAHRIPLPRRPRRAVLVRIGVTFGKNKILEIRARFLKKLRSGTCQNLLSYLVYKRCKKCFSG
jgi:hypothetical protein